MMLSLEAFPPVLLALVVSALITGIAMPHFIRFMRGEHLGQQILAEAPESHKKKQGTPTMGGIIMLAAVVITSLIFAKGTPRVILAVVTMALTGSLGILDDSESLHHKQNLGLTPSQKMAGLIAISVAFCLIAVNALGVSPTLNFTGGAVVDLGVLTTTIGGVRIPWLYVFFVFLLMAGLSNAVNLTDGLDGLAAGSVFGVMFALCLVCLMVGNGPLAVFAASIMGACVGFLWFNCNPAQIFMGDTGSLAWGAAIAAIAVLTKTEVSSLVMSGLFIVEACSVIIQVVHFKRTGKRVFLMTPIHHHFEKKGWAEQKVVVRFWIVSAAFVTLGFALFLAI